MYTFLFATAEVIFHHLQHLPSLWLCGKISETFSSSPLQRLLLREAYLKRMIVFTDSIRHRSSSMCAPSSQRAPSQNVASLIYMDFHREHRWTWNLAPVCSNHSNRSDYLLPKLTCFHLVDDYPALMFCCFLFRWQNELSIRWRSLVVLLKLQAVFRISSKHRVAVRVEPAEAFPCWWWSDSYDMFGLPLAFPDADLTKLGFSTQKL